tara:strand:+ start:1687 stop:2136 length:450 start_codon:yes stop_codon:yes gene_type:complete
MKKDDIENTKNLKFTDQYFKSFSIVYKREYIDSEDQYDPNFFIGSAIYKNVPMSKIKYYRKQLTKIKDILDRQYKEDATNFTGSTGIEIMYPDEYYQTYEDVFEDTAQGDKSLFNDYGQLYERQGFRKDFDPDLTKNYKTKRDYIYQLN